MSSLFKAGALLLMHQAHSLFQEQVHPSQPVEVMDPWTSTWTHGHHGPFSSLEPSGLSESAGE